MKVWTEFKRRVKPILATLKEDYKKEAEQSVLLDGITRLITQNSGQNTENMTVLVTSLKDTFKKDEVSSTTVAPGSNGGRTTKLTKGSFVVKGHVLGDLYQTNNSMARDLRS